MQGHRSSPGLATLVACLLCSSTASADDAAPKIVEAGSVLSFTYVMSLPDGEVLREFAQPIRIRQGENRFMAALEAGMIGIEQGATKTIEVPPEDAFGTVDESLFQEVPIDKIPEEYREVDATLGPQIPGNFARVAEVREDTVLLDLNHPLAGKTMVFEVTIVEVEGFITPP